MRKSPVREMVKELKEFGVEVYGYDPLLSQEEIEEFGVMALDEFNVVVDCVIVAVAHDEIKNKPFLMWGSAPRPRKPCKGLPERLSKGLKKAFSERKLFSKRTFSFLAQVLSLERKC